MKKKLVLMCLMVVFLLVGACSNSVSKKAKGKTESKTVVRVKKMVPQKFEVTLKLSAETKAYEDIMLNSMLAGTVDWMGYKVGEKVRKNDLLAQIDARMVKAQYKAAKTGFEAAKNTFNRQKRLYRKKLISAQVLEGVQAQYEAAKAQYELAKVSLEYAVIISPINGFISQKFVDKQEAVGPGMPIYNVVDLQAVRIEVGVSDNDLPFINKKTKVYVNIPSLGKVYKGYIDSIGLKADKDSKKFFITIVVRNKSFEIKAGMAADVKIVLENFENVMVLRQDYIIEKNGTKCVMLVDKKGKAAEKRIVLGPRSEQHVLIRSGISKDDLLITEGQNQVIDGQGVDIVE
jgi:membrane fusion protein, multidrug efflux system